MMAGPMSSSSMAPVRTGAVQPCWATEIARPMPLRKRTPSRMRSRVGSGAEAGAGVPEGDAEAKPNGAPETHLVVEQRIGDGGGGKLGAGGGKKAGAADHVRRTREKRNDAEDPKRRPQRAYARLGHASLPWSPQKTGGLGGPGRAPHRVCSAKPPAGARP